ncbi:uncharacterized protein EURHEDRAFT_412934 [Aspergillus ruber CBS 135680]|uniref:Apple domain-containing protein n=1 Tax=Aspergillus ruber (strain CBS 135680) TaxID=1388766 RepID=A0A017SC51_ASPRC|nr:uncharacterized protein EURHEDRAFT_412934 [Aspergillus ruber CBS 135680]EYE94593.1 hypothetical protein EURHEDRAFT_412934 [Aspergillus ruber CBS 135680]
MVKLFEPLSIFVLVTSFLNEIPIAQAQGLALSGQPGSTKMCQGPARKVTKRYKCGCCCCDTGPDVECNPQCPSSHTQIFQCNGRKYKQFCCVHVATATLRDLSSPSYQSCFGSCVKEPQCNALDYTNQHCWLKTQGVDPPPKLMNSKTDDISMIFLP